MKYPPIYLPFVSDSGMVEMLKVIDYAIEQLQTRHVDAICAAIHYYQPKKHIREFNRMPIADRAEYILRRDAAFFVKCVVRDGLGEHVSFIHWFRKHNPEAPDPIVSSLGMTTLQYEKELMKRLEPYRINRIEWLQQIKSAINSKRESK